MEISFSDRVLMWILRLLLGDAFVLMCLMFLMIGLFEWLMPARKVPRRHYARNLGYAFVNLAAITAITPTLSMATAYVIQKAGFGFVDLTALGFGGTGGILVAVLIGTFVYDFFQYWLHRLEHRNQVLWQEHLLHHSDEFMNVTTTARQHLFVYFLTPVFITIPTAIIFKLPPTGAGMLPLIPIAWQYVTHANIKLGFGPLWWLLVSPNYHRIHHSLEQPHLDKNFVLWFPILDILFRTAWAPRRGECPATGVAGVSVRSVLQAYLLPFVGWRRMILARRHAGQKPPDGRIGGSG